MDDKRRDSGQKLLDAAHEFWCACQSEGQHGAVQWLQGTTGELIIFTRSEYRDQLLANIWSLEDQTKTHRFIGEKMPQNEDDCLPEQQ